MDVIYVFIALLFLAAAFNWHRKINHCAPAKPSGAGGLNEYVFLTADGITLDDTQKKSVLAYASESGFKLIDIIPADLPAEQAIALAKVYHPKAYRRNRIAPPVSAGYAMAVSKGAAQRAGVTSDTSCKPDDFFQTAHMLKKHALTSAALAVEPALKVSTHPLSKGSRHLCRILGKFAPIYLVFDLFLLGVVLAGVFTGSLFAVAALLVFHLQPFIATCRTAVKPHDILSTVLFRTPLVFIYFIKGIVLYIKKRMAADYDCLRQSYDSLLSEGVEPFFIAPRDACPICGSKEIKFLVATPELVFHKPGRFVLEKCAGCGCIFQNPRLSIRGLDFYYKDYYDGIGAEVIELLLGSTDAAYLNRAKLFRNYCNPEKWLDVGGGSGYFCCVAKEIFPDTRFDGLDMSSGMTAAQQQGWVEHAYQGQFPEVSATIAQSYDVISMIQYLEHTIEPEQELKAAHTALKKDGVLIVEVPNPDFPLFKIIGKYWFQWLQPQHLYFFNIGTMKKLLKKNGFQPIGWDLTSAHAPIDFGSAAVLFVRNLVPSPIYPWLPKRSNAYFLFRGTVLVLCSPLIAAGVLMDLFLLPFFKLFKISNNYTVIAKKIQ